MVAQLSLSPRSWAELFALALIWGGSFLAIAVAVEEVPVLTLVTFRVGGAALVLWLVVALRRLSLPASPRVWLGIAGMALTNNIVPFTLIAWGQQHIPSGLASILNSSTAIFGVLIAAALFADERLTPRRALGVTLGFVGVVTALGLGSLAALDLTSLGQLAVLGAAMSYGISSSWGRVFLKGVPPLVSAAGMLTVSTLVMAPLAMARDGIPAGHYAASTVAALFYLAVIASGAAYLIFYRLLARVGAGNLSLVTLLIAPIAILLGALVLHERLEPRAYLGFALLALGLMILDGRIRLPKAKGPVAADRPPHQT